MSDWMEDQLSDPDESDGEQEEEVEEADNDFTRQLRTVLATGSVDSLELETLRNNIGDVEDVEALEKAFDEAQREQAQDIFGDRLDELVDYNPFSDESSETKEETSEDEEEEVDANDAAEDVSEESTDSASENATDSLREPPEPKDMEGDVDVIDVSDIAPGAVGPDEAANREKRWTIEIWSDPGMGKSHFGYSSQEPVCFIDTEGKADNLAHKFQDKTFFLWQPSDYDEALDALHEALDVLDRYREQTDKIGTIVVDSMSVMWGWSQQKYVEKFYPGQDVDEVNFSSGFGGGQSDWKQIKRYHNVKFRQVMIDCPYHLVWTAMREEDYSKVMEGEADSPPDKPAGEKENIYKVDEIIRLREDQQGRPVGELQKSGKIKHRYIGLSFPTFDKHRELVERIDEAERSASGDMSSIEDEYGVRVVEGNPRYLQED